MHSRIFEFERLMDARIQGLLRKVDCVLCLRWLDPAVHPHVAFEAQDLLLLELTNLLQLDEAVLQGRLVGLQRLVVVFPALVFFTLLFERLNQCALGLQLLAKSLRLLHADLRCVPTRVQPVAVLTQTDDPLDFRHLAEVDLKW